MGDYYTADLDAFRTGFLNRLSSLGLTQEEVYQLTLALRPGSIIANISGPPAVIAKVQGFPLAEMVVCGYQAFMSNEALHAGRAGGAGQLQRRQGEGAGEGGQEGG